MGVLAVGLAAFAAASGLALGAPLNAGEPARPAGVQRAAEPDRDGDGVPDSRDACPDQAAGGMPDGCPAESTPPGGSRPGPGDPGEPAPTPTPTPSPSPSPAPVPEAPPADEQAPAIVIPASNRRLTATRSGLVRFAVGPVTEPATGTVKLATARRVRMAGRRRVVALGTRSFAAAAGEVVRVRVRLSKRNRRLIRRLGQVRVRARVTLRDRAGNAAAERYGFTLRAPRR